MIKKLSVKNFKSIKEMEIDCRKINLFIGEPNTGKSNILEALGLLSWCGHAQAPLKEHVRFEDMSNIFYDNETIRSVEIKIESDSRTVDTVIESENDNTFLLQASVKSESGRIPMIESLVLFSIDLEFQDTLNHGIISEELQREFEDNNYPLSDEVTVTICGEDKWLISDGRKKYSVNKKESGLNIRRQRVFRVLDRSGIGKERLLLGLDFLQFYRFKKLNSFPEGGNSWLNSPHGSNMFALVMSNKKLRETVSEFFRSFDFKLMLRTETKSFEFLKEIDGVIFNYPYVLTSDTLQRMIFYTVAMESNKNATLILEEPESHAFPDYTYNLGKKIAFDKTNQYFIVTHNPYLFLSILEKTPRDNVNVFITYSEDYQTKVKCLNDEEKSKIMVYDPFANLDYFLGTLESFVEEDGQ